MKGKFKLKDFFPPGYDYEKSCKAFIFSTAAAATYSLGFLINYYKARERLFTIVRYVGEMEAKKVLREGAQIAPFEEIVNVSFIMFIAVFVSIFCGMVFQYFYYRDGSNSIYLIKRLSDKGFLWRTCFAAPFAGLVIALVIMGLLLTVYYSIYIGFTPAQCLP